MEPLSGILCPLCRSSSVTRADALEHMRGHAFARGWPTLRTLASALGPDLLPLPDRPPLREDGDEMVLADELAAVLAFRQTLHVAHQPTTEPMARLALLVDWVADGRQLCPPAIREHGNEQAAENEATELIAASDSLAQALKTACEMDGECRPKRPLDDVGNKPGNEDKPMPGAGSRSFWLCWLLLNEHWALALLRKFFYSPELTGDAVVIWAHWGVPPSDTMAPRLCRQLLAAHLEVTDEDFGDNSQEDPPQPQKKEARARRRAKLARSKIKAGGSPDRAPFLSVEALGPVAAEMRRLASMGTATPASERIAVCLAVVHRASSLVAPAELDRLLGTFLATTEEARAMASASSKFDPALFLSQSLALSGFYVQQSYPKAKLDSATLLAWAVEGPPPLPRTANAKTAAKTCPKAEKAPPNEDPQPPPEQPQPLRKPRAVEEPAKEEAQPPTDDAEWETVAKRSGGKSSKKKARVAPPKAVRRSSPLASPAPSPPPPPPGLSDKPAPRLSLLEHLGYDDELGEPLGLGPALRSLTLTARLVRRHGFLSLR